MTAFIDIVFDQAPSGDRLAGFIEVEDDKGKGICAGTWMQRDGSYWVLRITSEVFNGQTYMLRKYGAPKLTAEPLKFEVGKAYVDRAGHEWTVLGLDGPDSAPVRARCENVVPGGPHTRLFQGNGHYSPMRDERWDLIKEKGEPERPAQDAPIRDVTKFPPESSY